MKLLPASTTTLIIARVFSGMAGAGCFHVVPMYVKEIAQDSIRGSLSTVAALAQSIGILIMFLMGGFLDYYTVLWIVVGLPIITLGMFLKAPESPSYLVKVGKTEVSLNQILAFFFMPCLIIFEKNRYKYIFLFIGSYASSCIPKRSRC